MESMGYGSGHGACMYQVGNHAGWTIRPSQCGQRQSACRTDTGSYQTTESITGQSPHNGGTMNAILKSAIELNNTRHNGKYDMYIPSGATAEFAILIGLPRENFGWMHTAAHIARVVMQSHDINPDYVC
jgi:hypothetical protein